MKNAWFLLLTLSACSRSGPPDESIAAARAVSTPAALDTLSHPERHKERTILSAAGSLLRAGGSLDPGPALNCWRKEASRRQVQEACLLAWSAGSSASAELDEIVRAELRDANKRAVALAALKRPKLLESLALPELINVLQALAGDPAWLRARALRGWLAANDPPRAAKLALWRLLLPVEKFPSPLSLAAVYSLGQKLGLPDTVDLRRSYCLDDVTSGAPSRCFRFLSALVHFEGAAALPVDVRVGLPGRHNEFWLAFARDYPERAMILEPILNN